MPRRRPPRPACARASRTASGASPSMTGMMGCSPGSSSKPKARISLAEIARIRMQALAQLGRALQQIEHPQGRRRDRGRDAVREQIRSGALAQPTDYFLARGHIAAARAAQRLAQRAGHDVDSIHDAAQLVRAAAPRADEPRGVRVVDHHQGAVALGQIANLAGAWRSSRPWKKRRPSRSDAPGRPANPSRLARARSNRCSHSAAAGPCTGVCRR